MHATVVLRTAVFPLMKKQTVKAGGRFRCWVSGTMWQRRECYGNGSTQYHTDLGCAICQVGEQRGALAVLQFADMAIGIHFFEIVAIAIPVLIIVGIVVFVIGIRRGLRRD